MSTTIKKQITLFILLTITQTSFSQDVIGKWYMVNRSGLIEMIITKDSISTQKIFADFKSKGDKKESVSLAKIEKLNDRILLICRTKKDNSKFSAITVFNYSEKEHFQQAWNAPDTITDNISALIELNKKSNKKLFGYNCYSEKYMDALKKLKPIEDMPINDAKSYFTLYINKIKETEAEFAKEPVSYMGGTSHNFQIITQALFEIGYNPIQNSRTVSPLFEKYYKEPEIKKLIEEAIQK